MSTNFNPDARASVEKPLNLPISMTDLALTHTTSEKRKTPNAISEPNSVTDCRIRSKNEPKYAEWLRGAFRYSSCIRRSYAEATLLCRLSNRAPKDLLGKHESDVIGRLYGESAKMYGRETAGISSVIVAENAPRQPIENRIEIPLSW